MVGSATGPVVGSATAATMAVAAVRQVSGSAWQDRLASMVGELAHHGMHGSAEDLIVSNWNLFWKETHYIHTHICQRQVHSPKFEWKFLTNKGKDLMYLIKLFSMNSGPKVRYVEEILEAKILGN